jgi:hypothetical protein
MAALSWLCVIVAGVLLWFAERLLRPANYRPRVGGTLHCRKCDYLLKGLESDTCPECGATNTPATIARGDRRWRPLTLITGLLLLFLGLGFIIRAFNPLGGPIISYMPAALLIHNLKSPVSARNALVELWRRTDREELSTAQQEAIADALLTHLAQFPDSPAADEVVSHLSDQLERRRLSQSRQRRFIELMLANSHSGRSAAAGRALEVLIREHAWALLDSDQRDDTSQAILDSQARLYQLSVDPAPTAAKRLPFRLIYSGRALAFPLGYSIDALDLDGRPVKFGEAAFSLFGCASDIGLPKPGTHTLTVRLQIRVGTGVRTVSLSSTFHVPAATP